MQFDKYKKKTFSKDWNNFEKQSKNSSSFAYFLKKTKNFFYKILGFKISLKIIKYNEFKNEEFNSYQIDKDIIIYRNRLANETIKNFLLKFNINAKKTEIINFINQYQKIFYNSPIKDLRSGYGYNEGLILYCTLKKIKPTLVVESGVMKGFSTYIIHHATSNDCKIFCYDINFDNLIFKSNKAQYFNHDITLNHPNFKNHNSFALWDDHTSHLNRLKFSLKHKIKYNIFDDDLGFTNFHSDGWPPIPSLAMLYEIKDKVITKDEIEWICRNKKGKIWLSNFSSDKSINNIKYYHNFPNLFSISGYKNNSCSSFVMTN